MADFRSWLIICIFFQAGILPALPSPLLGECLQDGLYSSKMETTPSLLPVSLRKSAATEMKRIAKLHQRCVPQLTKNGGKLDCPLPSAAEDFHSSRMPVAERSLLAYLREERRLLEMLVLHEEPNKSGFLAEFYRLHRILVKEERRFGDVRDVYLMTLREEFDGMFRAYGLLHCGEETTSAMPASTDMTKWAGWMLENLAKLRQRAGTLAGNLDPNGK